MPELKNDAAVKGKKGSKKVEEQKPVESGTAQPLPTADNSPEQVAAETEAQKLARGIREKLEALKKELAAVKEKEKAAKDAAGAAKKAEKEAALAKRAEVQKQIEEADAKVKKCEEDLAKTEEFKLLITAKAEREAIGPLPKAPRAPRGEGGGGRKKAANGLTPNMIKVLQFLEDDKVANAAAIVTGTGILKGKRLPELVELGAIEELVPEEGQRGKRFKITESGKDQLAKALAEEPTT